MSHRLQIGILGSGPAGKTLGTGFLGRGHQVMIGSRDPAKLQTWLAGAGPEGQAGSFADAARFGELIVLSVLGSAAEEVLRLAGLDNIDGKILLDASDPLDFSSGRPGLFVGTTDSLGERIQRLLPQADVVKGLYRRGRGDGRPVSHRRRARHVHRRRQRAGQGNCDRAPG
jgi:8-hydroxy-5-deazaflavin:NADPH oxidoreductase